MDKLKFTDWFGVNAKFGSRGISVWKSVGDQTIFIVKDFLIQLFWTKSVFEPKYFWSKILQTHGYLFQILLTKTVHDRLDKTSACHVRSKD